MSDPLAAYVAPPRVTPIGGEILVTGEGVCASYTPEAALVLAQRLLDAVQQGQRSPDAPFH